MHLRRVHVITLLACAAPIAGAQTTTRESVDSNGFEVAEGGAMPAISADGRHVAFVSHTTELVPGFGNGVRQLYTRDRQTGVVLPVSVDLQGGVASGTVELIQHSMSADGSIIVFSGAADDLVAGDDNNTYDVFVRDVAAGVTELASVSSSGAQGNGFSTWASVSADGRYVCFESNATNLVAVDSNGSLPDVFVHDRVTGATEIVSLKTSGAQLITLDGVPEISPDGSTVTFGSHDVDVVPGDQNLTSDVFVRDLVHGVTERVSLADDGGEANGGSFTSSMSNDGRFVVFMSSADNLVSGDSNGQQDTFVRDRVAGTTVRADVGLAGEELGTGSPYSPSTISSDGRYVAFVTFEPIVPGDGLTFTDVFVRDLVLSQTLCASCRPNGQVGNRPSRAPVLSGDGRFVAFESEAKNLVIDDTNGSPDVLVRDLQNTVGPPLVDYNGPGKLNSFGCNPSIGASGAASIAGPMSLFVTGIDFIESAPGVLFWGSAPASIPFHGGNLNVAAPRVRFTALNTNATSSPSACLGRLSVRFDASYLTAHHLQAGDDVYAQFVARDPGYAPPNNFALSDGLHFVVQP
jgi:Tol biopolymer transport system component